jgi:hypothetical protein
LAKGLPEAVDAAEAAEAAAAEVAAAAAEAAAAEAAAAEAAAAEAAAAEAAAAVCRGEFAASARPEGGRFWFSALVTDRAMEAWYNFSIA